MLAWLKKLVGGAPDAPPTPPAAGPVAPYRIEESTTDGRTVRRIYNCHSGPEWLAEQLETGRNEAGQPWQRRTWYYAWGPLRRERTREGEESVLNCYFATGELRLRRQLKAGRLVDFYACEPLAAYAEQVPQYPGGDMTRLVRDIQRAFKYPALAKRNQEAGRVKVAFVVSAAGWLTDIRIIDLIGPAVRRLE